MQILKGEVIAIRDKRTAKVLVTRQWKHPLYKKYVKRTKNYLCDLDPKLGIKEGDRVTITDCKPVSKRKTFKVKGKIQ